MARVDFISILVPDFVTESSVTIDVQTIVAAFQGVVLDASVLSTTAFVIVLFLSVALSAGETVRVRRTS